MTDAGAIAGLAWALAGVTMVVHVAGVLTGLWGPAAPPFWIALVLLVVQGVAATADRAATDGAYD